MFYQTDPDTMTSYILIWISYILISTSLEQYILSSLIEILRPYSHMCKVYS